MYYLAEHMSPVGLLQLVTNQDNELVDLCIDGQKYKWDSLGLCSMMREGTPASAAASEWIDRYFAGENPSISELRLAPMGSEFRQGVWNLLREIPYGEVVTYGYIAGEMAKKMRKERMSSQAVGGAVGHNPISIIIPCHRVVGANGSLTGYGGGIHIKVKLLELEGVDMSRFFVPKKGTAL
ncbi:MAG: methylated-DNA--[protein]-cysteine S-methyltransferase [Oscillospiraceae bacterium]|nr:methylated-DNA--[protein]-cysteine S-methyltransferase [Oscillospiraceae bacterium]